MNSQHWNTNKNIFLQQMHSNVYHLFSGRTQSVENSRTAVQQQLDIQPTKTLAGKGSVIGATRKIGGNDFLKYLYIFTLIVIKKNKKEEGLLYVNLDLLNH